MVSLTRLNGKQFWLNAELIETVEETPDVVITLTNGHKYIVCEKGQTVIAAILHCHHSVCPAFTKGDAANEL